MYIKGLENLFSIRALVGRRRRIRKDSITPENKFSSDENIGSSQNDPHECPECAHGVCTLTWKPRRDTKKACA
jgi:hypothetical protein